MGIGVSYEVVVRDGRGHTILAFRGGNSLLYNFSRLVFGAGHSQSTVTVKDTGGTDRTVGWSYSATTKGLKSDTAAGVDTMSIVVGTGVVGVTPNDYTLASKILHGSGVGQLQYGLPTHGQPVIAADGGYFEISRSFTNGSGNDVNVNEIGLICRGYTAVTDYQFLILRDVLLSTVTVPNGGSLQVKYRIYATV